MNLFRRVLSRLIGPVEQRRRSPAAYGGTFTMGPHLPVGGLASVMLAENLSTVTACVELISATVAALPALIYETTPDGGRKEAGGHPLTRLIANGVNPRMSWFSWMSWLLGQELLWGNALSIIERDRDGQVVALWPVPWINVSVGLTPSGEMVFDVSNVATPWASYGERQRYLASEVLLISSRTDEGLLGRSVVSRAAAVVTNALSIQAFSSSVWAQSAQPSGVLQHPGALSPEAKDRIGQTFNAQFGGPAAAGRVAILEEGMVWQASGMSPEDAEVLASRRFTGEELARLFSVPPSLIGDLSHGSFSNVESAGRFFSVFCLAPHVRRIESEFARSVFMGDGHHLELDLAGLERGDTAARFATYNIALSQKVLSVAEVRQAEGWPPQLDTPGEPVPGGPEP